MARVSEHFSLEELCFTQVRLDNRPGGEETKNLYLLAAEQLEPVRSLLGVPLRINSAYRSPAVNRAVGGAANSQHVQGCAADIYPVGVGLKQTFLNIVASGIAYDQIIFEKPNASNTGWIHISRPAHGGKWRKQALLYIPGPDGKARYVAFTNEAQIPAA